VGKTPEGSEGTATTVLTRQRGAVARIAKLEAELVALRQELALERAARSTEARGARLDATQAEARHARVMAAGRAALATSEADRETLERANKAMRELEDNLQVTLELSPQIHWTADPDGMVTGANRRWYEVTGLSPSEAHGDKWRQAVHPDDLPDMEAAWNHSVRAGELYDVESRFRMGGGHYRWWRFRAAPRMSPDGRILRWYGTAEDVHDRRTAEDVLRAERERLQLILGSATDYAIFTMDAGRRITSWNAGAEQVLGWSAEEVIGMSGDILFTPEDREAGCPAEEAEKALSKGRAANERWHVRKDGSRFWSSGITMPLREPVADDGNRQVGLLRILRDQTERRQREEALRESERRLKATYDNAGVGIYEVDEFGRYIRVNETYLRMTGFSRADIEGKAFWDFLEDEATRRAAQGAYERLVRGEIDTYTSEPRYVDKSGRAWWAEVRATAIRDEHGRFLYAVRIIQDISERRAAEERRTLLVNELNHRVKNSLAIVQSLAAQTIRGALDLQSFMAAFQARLLALARAHDLLTRENWAAVRLDSVAEAVLNPVARLDGQPRIDLRGCTSEARLPPAPALFFAMALHELATNATKYGALSVPGGRVTVFCWADPGGGRPVVEWIERDGPPIGGPPMRRGFGMRLLQRGLAQGGLAAEMTFEPEGLRARIHLPSTEGQAGPAAQGTH